MSRTPGTTSEEVADRRTAILEESTLGTDYWTPAPENLLKPLWETEPEAENE